MWKNVLSIFGAFLLALSLAMNWQAFAELKEMETSAHLASYADQTHHDVASASVADHDHESDHEAAPQDHQTVAGNHTHKHRHAPGEPEHEHSQTDLGFIAASGAMTVSATASTSPLVIPPVRRTRLTADERVPSSGLLSWLLRPPIA